LHNDIGSSSLISFRSTSKSQSKRKVNWFEWTPSKSKSQMISSL